MHLMCKEGTEVTISLSSLPFNFEKPVIILCMVLYISEEFYNALPILPSLTWLAIWIYLWLHDSLSYIYIKKKQHLYSNFCLSCSQAHLYEFGRLKAQTPYMALEVFHTPFVFVGFCFHCVSGATAHCPLPVQPDDRTVVLVYWSGNLHVSSTPAEKQDFPRKSRFLFWAVSNLTLSLLSYLPVSLPAVLLMPGAPWHDSVMQGSGSTHLQSSSLLGELSVGLFLLAVISGWARSSVLTLHWLWPVFRSFFQEVAWRLAGTGMPYVHKF